MSVSIGSSDWQHALNKYEAEMNELWSSEAPSLVVQYLKL